MQRLRPSPMMGGPGGSAPPNNIGSSRISRPAPDVSHQGGGASFSSAPGRLSGPQWPGHITQLPENAFDKAQREARIGRGSGLQGMYEAKAEAEARCRAGDAAACGRAEMLDFKIKDAQSRMGGASDNQTREQGLVNQILAPPIRSR